MTAILDHVAIAIEGLDPRSAEVDRAARFLRRVAGVRLVHVDLLTEAIYVRFDPDRCSTATLTRTMCAAGFHEAWVS
jgi:hypothetical protein